ncbi:MAG: hypothetical protein WAW23_05620 [Candidatus Methanoperedens sp.]
MNTQDVVKALAEKGFDISEQEVQSKIDTFSKTFRLPAEEAARAALNHFISTNKLSAPVKNKAPAPVPAGQIQTPAAEPVLAQTAAAPTSAPQLRVATGISDRVFKLIKEMSQRVPYRLANYTELIKESETIGLSQKQVEDDVKTLIAEGKCIEPFIGKLYPVSHGKIG